MEIFNPPRRDIARVHKRHRQNGYRSCPWARTSRKHLSLILNGHTGISAEMALKFLVAFGTTPYFWLNFQKNYDLWQVRQKVGTSKITHFLNSAA